MNLNLSLNISVVSQPRFSALSSSSLRANPKILTVTTSNISKTPARDRIIDLGKHRGKMLGTLPSNYLRWISKNLRAGETEEWARLADQVLDDPVYRDRIEWEFAEKVLHGNTSTSGDGTGSVSQLLELSERFGWDNDDKAGWSRIDFGLLGTSKGGRIPRLDCGADGGGAPSLNGRKDDGGGKVEGVVNGGERRRERRERLMRQRVVTSDERSNGEESNGDDERVEDNGNGVAARSRFPGRDSLINKALLSRRRI